MQPDVVGVGAAVVDYIGLVDEYPAPDTQVKLKGFSKQAGGNVATALASLARLGIVTAFLGKLGDDELGRLVQQSFRAHGVDLSGSRILPGGSQGFAFITVESGTGRRTIAWTDEGKAHLAANELDTGLIRGCRYLHLDHYSMDAAIAAARIAREAGGVQVVLDAESVHADIETLLPMVHVLIVCADFARDYTGRRDCAQALDVLYERVPAHTVAITEGTNGSYCRNRDGRHRQPAFQIESVVDTTGCGDVYHGGFIYGLLQAWPLPDVARFASAAAALNAQGLGGQGGLPRLEEVERLQQKGRLLNASTA